MLNRCATASGAPPRAAARARSTSSSTTKASPITSGSRTHGVELVHVAQRGQGAVEQGLEVGCEPALHLTQVAHRHQEQADEDPGDEERAVRVALQREADQAEGHHHGAVDDEVGLAQQVVARARRSCRRTAPSSTCRASVSKRVVGNVVFAGGLDEVEERRAVAAEEDQRHQPPQRPEEREQRPPQHHRATARAGVAGQQPQGPERQHGRGRGRVDAADHRDGQGATAPRHAARAPGGADARAAAAPRARARSARPRSSWRPITVSMRGESAKARPPRMHARSERTPRARASRALPTNADAEHQRHPRAAGPPTPVRRCTSPSAKNGPIGHR